jgi:signal transduction histidine kinase
MMSRMRETSLARRLPAVVAVLLIALGVVATAQRLDAASDPSVLRLGGATWHANGVVIDVPGPSTTLRSGEIVTAIGGHRLADGIGGLPAPRFGTSVPYEIEDAGTQPVTIARADPYVLLKDGWGDLVFVVVFLVLAVALYLRRPDEPATPPLLVAAAGLFGSTLTVVAGLPALALAVGGPQAWLFHANIVGAYSVGWGGMIAAAPLFAPGRTRRRALPLAYAGPVLVMAVVAAALGIAVDNPIERIGLLNAAQTVVAAVSGLTVAGIGVLSYRGADPVGRRKLRWVAIGGITAAVSGVVGWNLPELITGEHLLPSGAVGLAGLPFVVGIAIALRRHRLFDIERLANRSLVYAAVVAVLVTVYAATVALLVAGLRLSDAVAAALAAAVAALALAPLRTAAQGVVNRVMYGDRDDPVGVLAGLGGRLQAVMLPDDVSPTVVETVARSLRVPYAAIDLADGDGRFHTVAAYGVVAGDVHTEPLLHYGDPVGRLHVSGRGRDDPLDRADLDVIRSLAQQVGPAVQAVRLHHDLVRSRAEVVALREDERRRLRRELHDGLGPALAAIALKAGLAARDVPAGAAHDLLGEITDEVKASLADVRRVVDALRPPAIDELGLVGAVRSRATALSGALTIEVIGPADRPALPAAVETAAYRIAVEAMTNAVRHSGGRTCTVCIEAGARDVVLEVRDDGGGLDPHRTPGVGLRSMHERAAELGGDCRVRSLAGGGTLVRARLPLEVGAPR